MLTANLNGNSLEAVQQAGFSEFVHALHSNDMHDAWTSQQSQECHAADRLLIETGNGAGTKSV